MNSTRAIEILLVKDSPLDLEMAVRALTKGKLANHIQLARDGVEALEIIFGANGYAEQVWERGPKIIMLDLKLPLPPSGQRARQVGGRLLPAPFRATRPRSGGLQGTT